MPAYFTDNQTMLVMLLEMLPSSQSLRNTRSPSSSIAAAALSFRINTCGKRPYAVSCCVPFRTQVIISQDDLTQLLPPPSDTLVHVVLPASGLGPLVGAAPVTSPGLLGRLSDLVYVIYTSGSTGVCVCVSTVLLMSGGPGCWLVTYATYAGCVLLIGFSSAPKQLKGVCVRTCM